ncbi:hypothetical protein Afil01_51460 [Actinorhabdospora filicis]|uniref:Pentapeptide repeat-containing protein n=1 Tax=Actinorhabdospora filicis TaxID=1785913 RepID=A0A9W6SNW9_9ACTN|nr:pentapeptide repeat-containing protein [Actinorhabdospora filicis]GLZ80339.1 hypothetical protein Afil01_51460 [Actinorhabdospora filicis]
MTDHDHDDDDEGFTNVIFGPACLAVLVWLLVWLLAGLPGLGWATIAISAIAIASGLVTAAIASAGLSRRARAARAGRDAEAHMVRAVELFGSADPVTRLAGAQAVDRVAMDEPRMRGDAMRLWCAYLRRPAPVETGASVIAPLGGGDGGADRVDPAEADLRRSILLLVQRRALDWPGLEVDLSGAVLPGVDFGEATIASAVFAGTVFAEAAGFEGVTFGGRADFSGAVFAHGASLAEARFQSEVSFHEVTVGDGVLDLTAAGFLDSLYLPVPAELTGASAARPDRVHATGWTVQDGYFSPLEQPGPAFEVE